MKQSNSLSKNRNLTIAVITAFIMIVVCLSVSSAVFAYNKSADKIYRYYTSIEIKPGDSLWSIASVYCADMDMSVSDYIKEIKRLNRLSSDSITSGQYLTIIYASDEYK
ncbi:MAG: LysM peptidoglycan-binding domain-containing protein [Alistipes sp.]|nr:LysM peptidoglycan-binding domain-containing protein [Alistipes sp.]